MEHKSELVGMLKVDLSEKSGCSYAATINRVVDPSEPVIDDGVFVRAMLVASEEINSQGGRFPVEELQRVVALIPGCPVLVGHNKGTLPIARCFHAELTERDDSNSKWVKVLFYWLKAISSAEDLRANIDGGVYSECSVGFTFRYPECNICGGDLRRCIHTPGCEYPDPDGHEIKCHYLYRGVSRVNEISIVYRGAVGGTRIGAVDLSEQESVESEDLEHSFEILNKPNGGSILACYSSDHSDDMYWEFPSDDFGALRPGIALLGKAVPEDSSREKLDRYDCGVCKFSQGPAGNIMLDLSGDRVRGQFVVRESVSDGKRKAALVRYPNLFSTP